MIKISKYSEVCRLRHLTNYGGLPVGIFRSLTVSQIKVLVSRAIKTSKENGVVLGPGTYGYEVAIYATNDNDKSRFWDAFDYHERKLLGRSVRVGKHQSVIGWRW